MAPPFGPFKGAGRRRGPPPFVIQMLRAPLTINNIVALSLTIYISADDYEVYSNSNLSVPFNLLIGLFGISIGHNVLSVLRFHRIRREVMRGERCSSCNNWKQQGPITLENDGARMERFSELSKRMPSLEVASVDLILSMLFLALFIWTTVAVSNMWGALRLATAYATIGALVAFVFNFVIGLGGLKIWFHQRKSKDVKLATIMSQEYLDASESLLPATDTKEESDSKGKQMAL